MFFRPVPQTPKYCAGSPLPARPGNIFSAGGGHFLLIGDAKIPLAGGDQLRSSAFRSLTSLTSNPVADSSLDRARHTVRYDWCWAPNPTIPSLSAAHPLGRRFVCAASQDNDRTKTNNSPKNFCNDNVSSQSKYFAEGYLFSRCVTAGQDFINEPGTKLNVCSGDRFIIHGWVEGRFQGTRRYSSRSINLTSKKLSTQITATTAST